MDVDIHAARRDSTGGMKSGSRLPSCERAKEMTEKGAKLSVSTGRARGGENGGSRSGDRPLAVGTRDQAATLKWLHAPFVCSERLSPRSRKSPDGPRPTTGSIQTR